MPVVLGLIALLTIPLALLNLLGGIVSVIWLAILGNWSAILLAAAFLFAGALLVPTLLMLPSVFLAGSGAVLFERGHSLFGLVLMLLSNFYLLILQVGWALAAFLSFGRLWEDGHAIPLWILSFGAATGVWSWLASKDVQSDPNSTSPMASFFNQIAYIVFSLLILLADWSLSDALLVLLAICAVPLVVLPIIFSRLLLRARSARP